MDVVRNSTRKLHRENQDSFWSACCPCNPHRPLWPLNSTDRSRHSSISTVRASGQTGDELPAVPQLSSSQGLGQLDREWEQWTWDASTQVRLLLARVHPCGILPTSPLIFNDLVMLQESTGMVDSAVSALIEAARLAAPLRKQERGLQVNPFPVLPHEILLAVPFLWLVPVAMLQCSCMGRGANSVCVINVGAYKVDMNIRRIYAISSCKCDIKPTGPWYLRPAGNPRNDTWRGLMINTI
jgi:hypothetical protein